MALPWLTIAKAVPWTDVIAHAPSVVNAARKLLQRKPGEAGANSTPTAPVPPASDHGPLTLEALTELVQASQAESATLRAQLAETQQLLQDLAEQQARTLAQVDENRTQLERLRRQLMLVAVVAILGVVLAVGLVAKGALPV